jgi:hypothetical protein
MIWITSHRAVVMAVGAVTVVEAVGHQSQGAQTILLQEQRQRLFRLQVAVRK